AAFLALRGRLDAQLPRWRALAERGGRAGGTGRRPDGSPDGWTARFVLLHLARLHGDPALARTAADQVGRADLRETVLLHHGAWPELLDPDPANHPPAG